VGDSLGLPAENLSPQRIQKRWPGPWTHRFVFGRGMVSDDTEHTVFVAQCLAENPVDAHAFQRQLAWKLRWWLVCLPAGIGFATLRAIHKLWLGFPPARSGVFSAGNGPAMRSAIIGAYFAGDDIGFKSTMTYVRASTRLTHTDPKAETAALAVALTAAWSATAAGSAASGKVIRPYWLLANIVDDPEWTSLVEKILRAHERQITVPEFASELGLQKGVTGYAYHTVPVALYAWLRHHGDFRSGIEAVLKCGGDTDTVGAITGALLAINSAIPDEWLDGLRDYPISRSYLERLALHLEAVPNGPQANPPFFNWLVLPLRNLAFLHIVLAHLCRRLLP
jgi:ADP-ribosyl-[dinitrogen reductase] hydrolase